MNDRSILTRIEALVDEEHTLIGREQSDAIRREALAVDRQRIQDVSTELGLCWDLLRQRRALRNAGQDPDGARARDGVTVKRYLQ